MPNRFYVRDFLNLPEHHAGAYVLARVEDTSTRAADEGDWVDVDFELADCSRRINLEFPLSSRSARRNSLWKARLLLDVVQRFVAALEEEARLADERDRVTARTRSRPSDARA